jgi:hypothetical protein
MAVFWNRDGFQVVTILPTGASFNAAWFIDGNLAPLRGHFFPAGRRSDQEKLMVHIDNASLHTAQMGRNFFTDNGLRKLAHSPCSPDIASSDFSLFGNVKNQLIGRSIQDEKVLLHEVMEILGQSQPLDCRTCFANG